MISVNDPTITIKNSSYTKAYRNTFIKTNCMVDNEKN